MDYNERFYYEDGQIFYRPEFKAKGIRRGFPVGNPNKDGHLKATVNKKTVFVHRIVWEMINGPIPDGMTIDHINHIRDDNRIENLRLATRQQNVHNTLQRDGNLPRGVRERNGRFFAVVKVGGKQVWGGGYSTPEEASEVATCMRNELHGGFACHV